MQSTQVVWEDDENNRQVVLSVQWTDGGSGTEVCGILPHQVRFLCPESRSVLRTLGVWTAAGRELLARQFQQSAQYASLHQELLSGTAAV